MPHPRKRQHLPRAVAQLVLALEGEKSVPPFVRCALKAIGDGATAFDQGVAVIKRKQPKALTALATWLCGEQAVALLDEATRTAWLRALKRINQGILATRAFSTGAGRPRSEIDPAAVQAVKRAELRRREVIVCKIKKMIRT